MQKNNLFLANEIKINLIDLLVKKHLNPVLGNELLFSKNKRRADIVLLNNNKIIAFEIKGDTDDTRRLSSQIRDYLSTFDEINIICTKKHLKRITCLIPNSVGMIIFDGKFKSIRKAKKNTRVTKENLIFFMRKSELLKNFKIGTTQDTTDEIRNKVARKCPLKTIKRVAFLSLQKRLTPISKLFLKDKGVVTINDDLLTLTGEVGPIR
ncbi:sce7726 family protein [Candidatus Avelusimicrobium sp.]|uniref:sce7726 family protein n=1 Tax=Candidatus Avelusimicrobium sp. TaxID=3048833 RepID=UPI003F7E0DED